MALIVADRVQELTTTSGTGTLTLNGAVSGFQTFSNGIGNTNTTYYTIYDSTAYVWEVGIGTVGAGTLSRDTVLANSLGTTAKINLAGNQASVFCTYPADKSVNLDASGNVTPLGTISSGTWQGTTIGVAYGGTGVTSSSGANSVVLRDSNQNITVNRLNQANTNVTAAGGTTTLTAASSYSQTLTGTGNQTYTMPDATTLTTGVDFVFNNNATGTLTIQDAASGTIGTVTAGGATAIMLLNNGTVAGTWNIHGFLPESVTWGTNALDLGTTVISNGTWQGGTIGSAYGGTGLTTFTAANNAIYSTGATTLTAGTLPVLAGGTGTTTSTGTGDVVLSIAPTLTGAVTIGSTSGSDTLTFGRSTGAQTVNIATGVNSLSTKTVNIATNGTNGNNIITIGPTATVTGDTTINLGTQARASGVTTVNIGTTATGGNITTTIGSAIGGSSTTINGALSVVPLAGNSVNISAPTTATITLGSANTTGAITLGQSTATNTINIQAGATTTGNTKTVNIGTGGVSGSTTNITIGTSSGGTSTTTLNGTVSLANPLAVESGGTGTTSLTANNVILGNGTSAVQFVAPGTNGNVLTSNGTTWTSAPPAGGGMVYPGAGIPNSTGSAWGTSYTTSGSGTVVALTTGPTLSGPTINDGYTEEVYAVVDAATPTPGVALSPTNGSIQTWTLGGNRTPTAGTWAAGQSITLMINDSASSFTVTWTSLPVTWVGGTAPSLAPASGFTIITLWKVGTTIYGALVGQVT